MSDERRPQRGARRASGKPADALAPFHPLVRDWFRETLGSPSDPQREGWPAIARGEHALLLAPTGTGKTLAAFLWELNALITEGQERPLANAIHLLYVSPLKALNNDVQRNLERPLAELQERFEGVGERFPEIRVAVRTGDTPSAARQRMLRRTPHILITTPESLHILLTSERGRGMFSALRAVIVDEIHAVAGTKRGAHLALTLERLEALCEVPPQRIGLSATQKPLEEIAKFLGGMATPAVPRPVTIVDCGLVKRLETTIRSPVADLGHVGGTVWTSVAPLVLQRLRQARTTLVFVNNRAQAEKVAARLNVLAGEEVALPYHGSLSRERRQELERRLKAGELRSVVSTSSLELGIDVGSVDLVVQLQSPRRVANALQRVGRAGHSLGEVSRGLFVPTFRDDAAEILAIVAAMREGDVEPTRVVRNALDVLAQIVVAAVSTDDDWTSARLLDLVRRAYPYHDLSRDAFDEVLAMLSGKYPADIASELEPRIAWDRASDLLSAPRGSRLLAVTSGGTIPDRGLYAAVLPDRTRLGELDEEFVHESRVGDVFQLGSSSWRVNSIEHDRVVVTPAPGAPARMPFWHGEFMARSSHLASRIGMLRRELTAAVTGDDLREIASRYDADEETVAALVEYLHQQRAATGIVPDDRALVVEWYRDEVGSVRLVLHAPFGGRVTAPWGMALAQRAREWLADLGARREAPERGGRHSSRLGPRFEVQVQTTDDAIMLRLPDLSTSLETGLGIAPPLGIFRDLTFEEVERRVIEEIGDSSLFGARFRMNAGRALLLPRGRPGRRMPLWLQRLKAADLLQTVKDFPSFPILVETYRDVLQDAFDLNALARVLGDLGEGRVMMREVATELPSPFAAAMQLGFVMDWMYADDAPRAEQRAQLLSLDRALLDELLGSPGADLETMQVLDELLARRRGTAVGRQARDADELATLLDRAGDLTHDELRARTAPAEQWRRGDPLRELLENGRAVVVELATARGPESRVVLADTIARYATAFDLDGSELPRAASGALTRTAARREILARWLVLAGPVTIEDVRARYDFDAPWIQRRLDESARAGRLVRGRFGGSEQLRWCSRRLLEEARRRELAAARRAVRAVEMPAFALFLQRWQHLHPDTRLSGSEGTGIVLRQLLGIARPAEGWEREYLAARVEGFDTNALSRLGASGELVWVGGGGIDEKSGSRALSTVRFLRRGSARAWLDTDARSGSALESSLGETAVRVRESLAAQGASFFAELQAMTGLSTPALRDALRELVAAGLVTNDTIEALHDLLRWRPVLPARDREPDPTRWLPEDFVPQSRPIVQRRPNLRRLPRWKRPDLEGGDRSWPGRWSLVRTARILGIPAQTSDESVEEEQALAEEVVAQWLVRYGVVARDWWRRERPTPSWRTIYEVLKRMEYRGEVRRGYFVRGLAGAQFARPEAVEALREAASHLEQGTTSAPIVVMAASDPASPWSIPPLPGATVEPLARPRGRGALLVTRDGVLLMAVEGGGRRIRVRPGLDLDSVAAASRAVAAHLLRRPRGGRVRDLVIEEIDGSPAAQSRLVEGFVAGGWRRATRELRWLAQG